MLTVGALCVGASLSAANSAGASTSTLRAQVDSIGAQFLTAQENARALDTELRALDQRLARIAHRKAVLLPAARARAVQIYQGSGQTFLSLFDTASAMESARRAELLARASDHTQALIDEYANTANTLQKARAAVAKARARQAALVAALAKQQVLLEHALAQAQQAYRDQLAAQAQAQAQARTNAARQSTARTTNPAGNAPTTTRPAPPAPVPVPPPAPPQSGENPHHNDTFLVCTRTRESSGDYTAVNLGGYYGAYQFSQPTWDLAASHAGSPQLIGVRPDRASPWDQDQVAWVLYQWRGNGPWGGLC
jgi:prefoldin subunit 5